MPVRKDPSGRRSVQAEVEVPGTPEEVWKAIASAAGITSWFVPAKIETDAQGRPTRFILNFGPGMDSLADVKSWDPPKKVALESLWNWLGPGAPPIATEWIVEARGGGKCLVRVVHSLFASTDDWDNQLNGVEEGWPDFFRILRIYLTHFRGQPGTQVQLSATTTEPKSAAWQKLTTALGFGHPREGQRGEAPAGAPAFAGAVEFATEGEHDQQLVRLDKPGPGVAHLFVMTMGDATYVSVRLILYGERASAAAAREEPLWQAWLGRLFPGA